MGAIPVQRDRGVMVVDDHEDSCHALAEFLHAKIRQAHVEAFVDPHKALRRVNERPFDIVIADLRMPQMSGLEFLTEVQRASPRTYRILITGQAAADAVLAPDPSHAELVLLKPLSTEPFARRIREILRVPEPGPTHR